MSPDDTSGRSVSYVALEPLTSPEASVEGIVYFRGITAVILHGHAVVKLACPFQVEKLPREAVNYWQDLQMPGVQFRLPW